MSKHILLDLDIGTTNVKVAAFNPDGDLLVETSVAYPTYYPHPGWSEQDPKDWEDVDAAIEKMKPQTTEVIPLPQNVEIYKVLCQEFRRKRDIVFEI